MTYYWIDFEDRNSACVAAPTTEAAIVIAAQHGTVQRCAGTLPYPAKPRLNNDGCPAFCYTPQRCVGRGSCPRNPACSS